MPSPLRSRVAPSLALLVAVVAVSWAAILVRLAEAPVLAIAFWRLALATLFLSAPAWWLARGRPAAAGKGSVMAAGFLLALHFALWIGSLFLTSVASSVLLVSTQPVFAALVTRPLLGEGISRRTMLAIGFTVAGTVVLAAGDAASGAGPRILLGDAMALAAARAALDDDAIAVERRFEPQLGEAEREGLYAGWKRAVERSRGWEIS